MRLGEALLDAVAQRGDRGGGDVGVGEARLRRPHDRLELLDAHLESPVVGPAPRQVEDVLLVVDLGQLRGEIGRHFRGRGQRTIEGGRQHRIEQLGAARQMGGEARRAAHDRRDQLEQRRIGLEQREELDAGRQVAEEEIEVQQRLVGRGGRAQRLQEAGHQLGQKLARARRRGRAVAAVMPAPHDAGRRRGIAEAQGRQGLERAGIVVGAGEDQVAAGAGQAGRLLEQPRVVAFHAMQVVEQVLLEGADSS